MKKELKDTNKISESEYDTRLKDIYQNYTKDLANITAALISGGGSDPKTASVGIKNTYNTKIGRS